MKGALLLLLLASPLSADICADTTTLTVELSTGDYAAPASTTTSKTELLRKLYATRYERDTLQLRWLDALNQNQSLENENSTLRWRVYCSTR